MRSRRRGCGGCLVRLFLFAFLFAVIAAGAILWWLTAPFAGFHGETFVDIEKGAGTTGIAAELARDGAIRSPWQFDIIRILRPGATLQAGEYRFAHADSPWSVFDRIARGDVFYYELTVPEGSNMFDIAAAIDQLGFLHGSDFLEAARDPAPIHDIAPRAPTLEGFLVPVHLSHHSPRHRGPACAA